MKAPSVNLRHSASEGCVQSNETPRGAEAAGDMMGRLTTHVLDTSSGKPGAGIAWTLFRLNPERQQVAAGVTNDDGRADGPILEGSAFTAGAYEIVFEVGAYFREHGAALSDPPFLDTVPVRFGVADADTHYHVPLLVSPFGYSTYRGS